MANTATRAPFTAALNQRLREQTGATLDQVLASDPRYQPAGPVVNNRPGVMYKNGQSL